MACKSEAIPWSRTPTVWWPPVPSRKVCPQTCSFWSVCPSTGPPPRNQPAWPLHVPTATHWQLVRAQREVGISAKDTAAQKNNQTSSSLPTFISVSWVLNLWNNGVLLGLVKREFNYGHLILMDTIDLLSSLEANLKGGAEISIKYWCVFGGTWGFIDRDL